MASIPNIRMQYTNLQHMFPRRNGKQNDHNVSVSGCLQGFWYYRSYYLAEKLHFYGIRGIALEWIRNYLTRPNTVSIVQKHDAICGVPQGSVFYPLLFIIYPNHFQKHYCIQNAYYLLIHQTLRKNAENDLISLRDWFRANNLSLNVLKTNFVLFAPKTCHWVYSTYN